MIQRMLDFKAAKMEAALLGGLIRAIVPKLISLGHERYKLQKTVKSDIEFLVKELRLIVGSIDDGISEQGEDHAGPCRACSSKTCASWLSASRTSWTASCTTQSGSSSRPRSRKLFGSPRCCALACSSPAPPSGGG